MLTMRLLTSSSSRLAASVSAGGSGTVNVGFAGSDVDVAGLSCAQAVPTNMPTARSMASELEETGIGLILS
jgi:hypothetical protein